MAKKRTIRFDWLVLLFFLLSTIAITYPLIFNLDTMVFGYTDELLITWILNWNIHALFDNILDFYNSNIFYPYHLTLTFSDAFITSSIIGLLTKLWTNEPLAVYNFNIIFSITSLGFTTYLLVKHLSKNIFAGIISGTLMAFSIYTVTRYFHLQLISIFWLPLAILAFIKFIESGKIRYYIVFIFCVIAQAANSFFPIYLLGWSLFILSVIITLNNSKLLKKLFDKKVLLLSFLTIFIIFLLAKPYLETSSNFNYVRDIRDTINFANRQEYILYPSNKTKLESFLKKSFYTNDSNKLKHDGYWGFALILCSLFVLINYIKYRNQNYSIYTKSFILIAFSSYILSLGPALQWFGKVIKSPTLIPLPYAIFYYLIPGFKAFRNSARWELLVVFSLSIIIGLFFAQKFQKTNIKIQFIITFIICSLVFLEIKLPLEYVKVPTYSKYPSIYTEIHKLPQNTRLIELPLYNWNMTPFAVKENLRLLYNTKHFKQTVNGTSGFYPPEWEEWSLYYIFNFPDKKSINHLREIGATHIILHKDDYDQMEKVKYKLQGREVRYWSEISNELKKYTNVKFVKRFGNIYLYSLD